ncbi:hypothetical protein [Corynebacterium accolens]|uniref:hypothetical protein n=1 Tax=Corynebacterium accolens TaxID=38284 RepID=UPI0025434A56|nr:hypothetical protein [Corynebacterium accolens]MDK4309509.1 hypothetical protein [Corynebacterium accolens]
MDRDAFIDAYTLGYLKAALKDHLVADIVDSLFTEAEDAALESAGAKASHTQPEVV